MQPISAMPITDGDGIIPPTPPLNAPQAIGVGLFHRGVSNNRPTNSSSDAAWSGKAILANYVKGTVIEQYWSDLQTTNGGTFVTPNDITSGITFCNSNALQLKVRVFFGAHSPTWAMNLSVGGSPLTLADPTGGGSFQCPHFWEPALVQASATDFWQQFATLYNSYVGAPLVDVAMTGPMTHYAEPMLRQSPGSPANRAIYSAANYTLALDIAAHASHINAMSILTVPASYAGNPFQSGLSASYIVGQCEQQHQYHRDTLGLFGSVGNNSMRFRAGSAQGPDESYDSIYTKIQALGPPSYIQTAQPGLVADLYQTCLGAAALGCTYIELPGTTAQYTAVTSSPTTAMSPAQFDTINGLLSANAATIGY
jgi:hypothetical protein